VQVHTPNLVCPGQVLVDCWVIACCCAFLARRLTLLVVVFVSCVIDTGTIIDGFSPAIMPTSIVENTGLEDGETGIEATVEAALDGAGSSLLVAISENPPTVSEDKVIESTLAMANETAEGATEAAVQSAMASILTSISGNHFENEVQEQPSELARNTTPTETDVAVEPSGNKAGFVPAPQIGYHENNPDETFNFIKSYDPNDLNAWNGNMPSTKDTMFESPTIYPGTRVRTFAYPERDENLCAWVVDWEEEDLDGGGSDPYHDFDASRTGGHHVSKLRFQVGQMHKPEVENFIKKTGKYLKLDYLSYYTNWSQRFTSNYSEANDFFPLYFSSGEGTALYDWFNKSYTDTDDSDTAVQKLVDSVWKRIHPPSYYLFRDRKIEAFGKKEECAYNTPTYRRNRLVFGKIPQEFSIMKKRVIGILAGNGRHFASYLVINFGAHFQEGISSEKPRTFIADCDSMYFGEPDNEMAPFVYFILSVIYELERWIGHFQITPAGYEFVNPPLVAIGRNCLVNAKQHLGLVCSIPMDFVKNIPQQVDGWNCGIFALLNQRACFLADVHRHVLWSDVKNVFHLWEQVLEPFWNLPDDSHAIITDRPHKFRKNLIELLVSTAYGQTTIGGKRDSPVELESKGGSGVTGKVGSASQGSQVDSDSVEGSKAESVPANSKGTSNSKSKSDSSSSSSSSSDSSSSSNDSSKKPGNDHQTSSHNNPGSVLVSNDHSKKAGEGSRMESSQSQHGEPPQDVMINDGGGR
jgi:hypothetical protein